MRSTLPPASPRGLDARVRDRLHGEILKAVADPAFTRLLDILAAAPAPSTPAELQALLAFEVKRWRATAERAGVRAE